MSGPTEGEVTIVLAGDVQGIGIREALWISISCSHHRDDRLPLANRLAAKNHVIGSQARRVLAGAIVSEQFLDGGRDERSIVAQHLKR